MEGRGEGERGEGKGRVERSSETGERGDSGWLGNEEWRMK